MQRNVFFGKLKEGLEGIKEGGAKYTVPALILAGITVLVGVLFPLVLRWMQQQGWLTALGLLRMSKHITLTNPLGRYRID